MVLYLHSSVSVQLRTGRCVLLQRDRPVTPASCCCFPLPVPVLSSHLSFVWAPRLLPVAAASAVLLPTGHSSLVAHLSHKLPLCLSMWFFQNPQKQKNLKRASAGRAYHQVHRQCLVSSRNVTGKSSEGEISRRSKYLQEPVTMK